MTATKTEWLWTMNKPQVPLAQGLHLIAIQLMQKNLGITTDLPIKHVNGDIYFGKKEVKKIEAKIKEEVDKDSTYPDKIERKIQNIVKKIEKTKEQLQKIDPTKCTEKELLTHFIEGYNVIAEMTAFMSFKCTVEMSDVLEEKIRLLLRKKIEDIEERNNIFLLLSLPKKESFMTKERKSIQGVVESKNKEKQLEKHTKEFSWMGCVMYAGVPYTKAHFEKELKDSKPIKLKNKEKEIKETIKDLHLTEKEIMLLNQFRTWTHLRTFVKEMTSVGMEPTIPFLREITKRTQRTYKDILFLSHTELQEVFTKKKDAMIKESRLRQNGWGLVLMKNKAVYYNHKTVKEIEEPEDKIPSGVKGFAACQGRVKGKAIVIKTVADIDKVQKGDILITHMTTTNFIPILSKVAAIVTDEGGITCHAAIISREMDIPCIIGTRFATKAFKSGDVVEVDAVKGLVKKV
jgi:phosphohistidine swiveling domain-containing protein